MSANRDKSHKVTFVFQNLHHVYRQGLDAAKSAQVPPPVPSQVARENALAGVVRGKVIKAYEQQDARVATHQPVELLGKRVDATQSAVSMASQRQAIQSLQDNLKTLGDLHSRLRFMLKELEDLVKE